jgi:NitT/TauT family transport system substrate-binding protein
MSHLSRREVLAGAGAVGLTALASPVRAQPNDKLRIGVTPTEVYAEAYFANEMGFFREANVDADVQTLSSGSAAANAIAGGSLDVGVTTPLLLANAIDRGVPFTLIAAGPLCTPKGPQSLLCVKASSSIRSAKDLEGKTVGLIVLKTTQELSLDAWLEANGANRRAVRRVEVTFPEMGPALERGTIDAATISEPFLTKAIKSGVARSIANPNLAIAPTFLLGAWFTTKAFAERNPELIRRFANVIYRTAKWANQNQRQSAAIITKYLKIPLDVTTTMTRTEFAEAMDLSQMQALLDASYRLGYVSKPVAAASLVWKA